VTTSRVYDGSYGPLPPPETMGLEAAGVVVSFAQDVLARLATAIEALEDDAVTAAMFGLRDAEEDVAAYLVAASARRRNLEGGNA
jgi:hypothetical protein